MELEFYTMDQLSFDGAELGAIREIEVTGAPGEHSCLRIKAQTDERYEETLLHKLASRQPGSLLANGQVLFCGLLSDVRFYVNDEARFAELTYLSATCLLDVKRKSRSFQDASMTWSGLVRRVLGDYPGADFMLSVPDSAIGRLIIQYEETDWAFLKRVFSESFTALAPVAKQPEIRFYAGVPQTENSIACRLEAVEKDEEEVMRMQALGAAEADFTTCTVCTGSCLQLFETALFEGRQAAVCGFTWTLVRGMLESRLKLRSAAAIGAYPIYPIALVGIALEGKILAVTGNQVRVHMDIDNDDGGADVHWFPYATMSASLDGSGWYYMPEVGDRIRVEFPTKHAEDSLVINSASVYDAPSGGGKDLMGDPSSKYLSNRYGQNMTLGPSGINISCGGSSGVVIDNGGTVVIWGSNEIVVNAENKITIQSESITIHAAEEIKAANAAGTGADMKSEIELTGAEVLIN